jgi:predicted outer membrane repeat protein
VTIYGNMPIIVSGNNAVRVFNIAAGNGVTFDSLTIANGRVDDYDIGAGVYNNGTLTVRNSAIVDNVAVNGAGGGIYNHSTGTLVVFNSTFTGNQGPDDGGAIRNEGTATVRNSTFHNNSASLYAGGAIHTHGNLTVDNSTFSENSANIGGAIHVHIATAVTIRNSTFIGNSASIIGGGINVTSGNVHLSNSIIASSLTGMDCNGSLATNANNLIEDNSCSPALSGDPMVGPLQNNGGDTLTFALLPGSPAIGAGNCTSGPTTDQRGVARSQDADCDMGAYEETGTLQCGVTAGNSYPFPNQSGVSIFVNSESDLECLYVDELPFNHPHATGLTDGANLRTGKYWLIGGFQANGTTPAATFNVDLTLPYATASASTRACKWLDGVGPGAGWNCEDGVMGTTFLDGVSVTREDVTAFSQWAVGDSVGPTAVTLSSFSTTPTASSASLLLLLVLLAGLGAVWQWKRRTAVG